MSPAPRDSRGLAGAGFDLSDLVRLRGEAGRLRLAAHVTAVSSRIGAHASRIRGRGMSFAESRPYQPGDDVRLIDWRVTARSGRPHTKVFEEEKERAVYIVAQFSPSMYFGTRVAFKHVVAAELISLVAWAALAGGDRLGALLSSPRGHVERRPAAGRRTVMGLLGELATLASPPSGDAMPPLSETLGRVARVARPGSLVFVVGDLYDFDEAAARPLARLTRHNDIAICQVLDTVEVDAPPPGTYPVGDGRRLGEIRVGRRGEPGPWTTLDRRLREPVREFVRRHRALHGLVCAGYGVVDQVDGILSRANETPDQRRDGPARRSA